MSPAEEIQAAAEKLRELATDATPGPWRQHDTHLDHGGHTATVLSGKGNDTQLRAWLPTMSHESWDNARNVWADSAYIAAVHPGVGIAIAKWLESFEGIDFTDHGPMSEDLEHALAAARAINATPA